MRYKYHRLYKWSKGIAYAVGLIASDGCLQKDGRHIDLTSKDIEQLHNFCAAIGRPIPITDKFNKTGLPAKRIQFSDVAFYDFLVGAGVSPSKSHTIHNVKVPNEFYGDFLRGVFDGDGTCYGYFDPRWKNSFMYYVSISSASRSFMEFLQSQNRDIVGLKAGKIRQATRVFCLTYAKKDSQKLAEYIYNDPGAICLSRKRDKLNKFIANNRGDILNSNARVVKLVNTLP